MTRLGITKEGNPSVQLVVDARLRDVGLQSPRPGVIYSVSLMQYEVLEVVQGIYSHPFIFVGHHLPDLGGAEFIVGAKHRLYLTKKFPEHASILDRYQTPISGREPYYCLRFEVK